MKNASAKPHGKSGPANDLEKQWAAANPRPHWTTAFWERARPNFDEETDGEA